MKRKLTYKLCIILLSVFLTGQTIHAQGSGWELVYDEIVSLGTIKGIVFVPGDDYSWETGWAAQYNGNVLKTTDGGDTWTNNDNGISTNVWGIDFIDEDTGYLCDLDGRILKSIDGGINWTTVFNNSAYAFNKIKFKDANNGVATGYPKNVYTTDGGTTWEDATGGSDYWGLDYAGGDTYYGVTSFTGEVGETSDNGQNWSTVHTTGFGLTVCVNFLDETYGIVGGSEYKVKVTTDGASSWTQSNVDGGSGEILAADWFDKDTLWVCGVGIYKSTDGGSSWTQDTTMWASGIANREMYITGMNTIFVSGDNIGTSESQIWRKIEPSPLQADFEADETTICSGSSVDFTDLSIGNTLTWDWTFEGGTPSSSTDQNPTVVYNSTGVFDVELTITDQAGDDTKIVYDYITVLETPGKADTPDGEESVCTGMIYQYSIAEVDFTQDYEWELSPADAGTLTGDWNEATFETDDAWTGDFIIRVRATNICGDGDWSDNLEGTLYISPEEFGLEGGGGYCLGDEGVEITLNGSQSGVDYELYLDGVATGIIEGGTGSEISFGLVTDEGYYTAVASNTNCDFIMFNQVHVYLEFPPLEPETPTGPETVCNDDVSDYESAGAEDADTYEWMLSPGEAGTLIANGLEVTVEWNTDFSGEAYLSLYGINECGDGNPSDELEITVEGPAPEVTGEDLVCANHFEDYATTDNEGSTYTWEVTGGSISEGQGSSMITVEWGEPGTGYITVEEETEIGCTGVSEEFEVMIDDCTGIGEDKPDILFSIHPNPADEFVIIQSETIIGSIHVFSITGEKIEEVQVDKTKTILNTSMYQAGIYLIRISTEKGTFSKRLIIE